MNKVFINLVMCMFMTILLVGVVSAWEWDNVKSYDAGTKTYEITNALGMGNKIADVTLNSEQHRRMFLGDYVFELEIDSADLYDGWFKEIEVWKNDINGAKVLGEFNYKIYDENYVWNETINTYDCEDKILKIKCSGGEELVERIGGWRDLDVTSEKFKGEKLIRAYFPDAVAGQKYEWIATLYGEKLTDWADFTGYTLVESYTGGDDEGDVYYGLGATNSKVSCMNFSVGTNGSSKNVTPAGLSIKMGFDVSESQSHSFMILNSTGGNKPCLKDVNGCDGMIMGNTSWDSPQDATPKWYNYTFDSNTIVLNNSETYWLCINTTEAGNDQPFIRVDQDGDYDGGNWLGWDEDGCGCWRYTTDGLPGATYYDVLFKIYGDEFSTAPVVTLDVPANNTGSATGIINFKCSAVDDGAEVVNTSLWINGVANYSVDNVGTANLSLDKTVTFTTGGFYNWTCKGEDIGALVGVAGSRNFTVDFVAPVVSVANNLTDITTPTIPVNSSWNYTSADNLKLGDCYYTTSDNATISYPVCNVSDIKTQWQTGGSKTITYCANDTAGTETCRVATLEIDYYSYGQNGDKYVTEGTAHTYSLKINDTSIPTTTVRFMFNGTAYAPTTTVSSANTYNFTRVFTIPDGLGNSSGKNDTWYWAVNLTGKSKFNTTFQNTTVYSVELDDCSTFGTVILNLSLRDEETDDNITILPTQNTTVEIDLSLTSNLDSSLSWDFSTEWVNQTNLTVCVPDGLFTGASTSYRLDINEVRYFADNYVTEFYYLDNFNLSNATVPKFIALRDLLADDSTSFVVSYTDDNNLLVADAIISVLRKYEEVGEFREVENGKTSNDGETILHLVEEDVVYIFNVTIDGVHEYTSSQYRVYCEAGSTCVITLDASSDVDDFPTYWDNLPEGSYNLSVNRATRTITLAFNLNETTIMNLTVYQYSNNDSVMDIAIVSNTTTASSGTTFVYVPVTYGNETFYATVYKDGIWIASHFVDLKSDISDYVGLPLTAFMIAMIVMAMGLMAVATGVGVIIFALFGIFIALAMALITGSGTWSIISIIVAGIIVIGLIYKRRSRD